MPEHREFDPAARAAANAAPGFMPEEEGLALREAVFRAPAGLLVEVGTYAAKSTCYIGDAARARGLALVTVDHHRGSEENQPGEQYHDPHLTDEDGRVDTLPAARRTLARAGLEATVILVCGQSEQVARAWSTPLTFLFLDGGHSGTVQHGDYDAWGRHLAKGGVLAIHDVFPDPRDGGRPPYEVYLRALGDGYSHDAATGSLRILRRER